MPGSTERRGWAILYAVPFAVLVLLVTYTYASFLERPYGFAWDAGGTVTAVFDSQHDPSIEVGDRLMQVGPVAWEGFQRDLTKTLFGPVAPGQTVPIIVARHGSTLTIPWTLPAVNWAQVRSQLFGEWFLAYIFWGIGTMVLLFVRPRDDRWMLLIAFNFLTAIAVSTASGAAGYHLWYSALVLRSAIWLSIPIYLHLHWVFPQPLGRLPVSVLALTYGTAGMLAVAQWFQVLPPDAYLIGFVLAVVGSLTLLFLHAARHPDSRSELFFVWLAALLALVPVAAAAILRIAGTTAPVSGLAVLSLPALPLAYVYAAYRRQLGRLEVPANRLLSVYLFLIALGAIGAPLIAGAQWLFPAASATLPLAAVTGFLVALISIYGYPRFRTLVERRWLGINLQTQHLPQTYSGRARSRTSIEGLLDLLEREVLPSILTRQFLFLRVDEGTPSVLLKVGIEDGQDVTMEDLATLRAPDSTTAAGVSPEIRGRMPWVRLMLPLRVGERLVGAWFLGRRDPDDYYPREDALILQSLADQTALTLSNIVQSELLQAAYRADINRQDQERLHLALDLHDGVLNGMAALLMRLEDSSLTPAVQKAYDALVRQVREIVNGLRPPLLNYGLEPAIHELVESPSLGQGVQFKLRLEGEGCRYERSVEEHVFRIVQEAFSNAVRHGHPSEVRLSGRLGPSVIDLTVSDNGSGFQIERMRRWGDLLANRHFGLLGMRERAEVIGASVRIDSRPGAGTSVRIRWTAPET